MTKKNAIDRWRSSLSNNSAPVSPFAYYEGTTVIDRIEKAQNAVAQFSLNFIIDFGNAKTDMQHLLDVLNAWCDRVSDVALVAGAGDTLCAWLRSKDVHGKLIGGLHELQDTLKMYREKRLDLIPADDLGLAQMTTEIEHLASACLRVQKGNDNGEAVIDWMAERKSLWQKSASAFKRHIDLGGRPDSPVLQAIHRLGYKEALLHASKWNLIAKKIWESIDKVSEREGSEDKNLVYEAWERKSIKQRSDQVRQAFRKIDETFNGI